MATRLVKALDAANGAEQVVRCAGTEAVAGQLFRAAFQHELVMRYDDVKKTGRRADRAIAVQCGNGRLRQLAPEPHRSTMASAVMFAHAPNMARAAVSRQSARGDPDRAGATRSQSDIALLPRLDEDVVAALADIVAPGRVDVRNVSAQIDRRAGDASFEMPLPR